LTPAADEPSHPMPSLPSAKLESISFPEAAAEVGSRIRASICSLLEQIPGEPSIRTGSELAAALEIDINLAWKLLNISKPGPATGALQRLPGDGGVRILLNAAERKNVPAGVIEEVRAAFAAYSQLLDKHAGDRAALDSLLTHASGGDRRIDLATRRAAFRANSGMLGVQAAIQLGTYLFWPEAHGEEPSSAAAILRGFGGFRRLRPDVSWVIGRARRTDLQGRPYGQRSPEPLEPRTAAVHGGVPLVTLFSHDDLPPLRRTIMPDGIAIDRVVAGPVGLQASQSFFLAETMRPGLGRRNDPENPALRLVTSVHTPCELLVFDAIFHKDLARLGEPTLTTASELGGVSVGYCDPVDRVLLHVGAEIEDHGLGLRTMHIAELPRYTEMLGSVCERLGLRTSDMHAYRVKIAYPPIPCGVMIERDMNPA
jgi:hypothetical protein